jgi:hypothetical protein
VKARYVMGVALAATGIAFALGFATTPVGHATPGPAVAAIVLPKPPAAADPSPPPKAGRRPLSTVRRFDPPPIPAEDPGIAEIVNGPDEPAADVIAARWDDIDRRLEELFGKLPADKLTAMKAATTSWIRDHGRVVRAYYRGNIDQAELTENVHANLLSYARSVEATLTRDQYRTFMDLEPGDDPYIVLVPPGVTVGQPLSETTNPNNSDPGGHADDHAPAEDYGNPEKKVMP